jgi:hypothetical protein
MESCVISVKDYIKSFFDPLTAHIINEYLIIINDDASIKFSFKLSSGIINFKDKYNMTIEIDDKIGITIIEDDEMAYFERELYLTQYIFEDFYNSFLIDEKYFTNNLHFVKNNEYDKFKPTLLTAPKKTMEFSFNSNSELIFLCRKNEGGPYCRYLIFNNRNCLKQFLIDCEHIMYTLKHYLLHELNKLSHMYNRIYPEKHKKAIREHDIDKFKLPTYNDLSCRACYRD